MRRYKFKVCVLVIIFFCVNIFIIPAVADNAAMRDINVIFNTLNISVNKKPVTVDNILYEGTTYAPLRAVAEMFGKKVGWNEETNTASIDDNANTSVAETVTPVASSNKGEAVVLAAFNKVNLTVNGKPVSVDNILLNGATYAPVRAIAELLGKNVGWYEATKTISIDDSQVKVITAKEAADRQLSLSYKIRDNATVGFNYNIELLQIAAAQGADFNHKGYLGGNTNLNTLVKGYFKNFSRKNYQDDLLKLTSDGIVNKYIHGETEAILAYDYKLESPLYVFNDKQNFLKEGTITNYSQLIKALVDYKAHTSSDDYFLQNEKAYKEVIDGFKSKINFDYLERIENVMGYKLENASFNIILSPSMNGGTAIALKDGYGNPVYFNIMNPTNSNQSTLMTLYHEEIHNFLRPILEKNPQRYSNSNYVNSLKKDVGPSNAINETVTRALTNIILEKYHPDVDIKSVMADNLKAGWINTDKIYDYMKKEYIGDRNKYKNFEEFMPDLVLFIKSLEGVKTSFELDKYGYNLNNDTTLYIYGPKAFCESIQKELPYWGIGKSASVNYFEETALTKTNSLIFFSVENSYSSIPQKVKAVVSEADFKGIKQGEYLFKKIGEVGVVIVNK